MAVVKSDQEIKEKEEYIKRRSIYQPSHYYRYPHGWEPRGTE